MIDDDALTSWTQEPPPHWRDVLTLAERKELLKMNPFRAWGTILVDWAIIFASMAMVAWMPNPFTILLALVLTFSGGLHPGRWGRQPSPCSCR
jgi:hypothetical protein